MRSVRSATWAIVLAGVTGLALSACKGSGPSDEEKPIVVEQNGPIELGDSLPESTPSAEEVSVVEQPKPQPTRTVVIRERGPRNQAPAAETPSETPRENVTPSRPTAIPAGTAIPFTILAQIDSEHNQVGDTWTGRVSHDIVVAGHVVIPAGAAISGVVTAMNEGDRNGGRGYVTLDARSVETVNGTRSIAAAPVSGGHSYGDKGFPTKETAIGAGAGAVLGGVIGGKKGAAIGAAAGGAGGAAMGKARNDQEVALNSGSGLTITIQAPVAL